MANKLNPSKICSIRNCLAEITEFESGKLTHWAVTTCYCHEHFRELQAGTPLGPVGVDPSKVEVESLGVNIPITGGNCAVSPQ